MDYTWPSGLSDLAQRPRAFVDEATADLYTTDYAGTDLPSIDDSTIPIAPTPMKEHAS